MMYLQEAEAAVLQQGDLDSGTPLLSVELYDNDLDSVTPLQSVELYDNDLDYVTLLLYNVL